MFPNSMKFAKSAVKQAAEAEKAKANKVKQIKQMLLLLSKIDILPDGYIDWTEYSRTIARKRMRWAIRLASKEAKNDPENQ